MAQGQSYIAYKKIDNIVKYYQLFNNKGSYRPTENLTNNVSTFATATTIDGMIALSIKKSYNDEPIVAIKSNFDEINEILKTHSDKHKSEILNKDNFIELTSDWYTLHKMFRDINGRDIFFEEVVEFQERLPLFKSQASEKITLLKELYIREIYDNYISKKRTSEIKADALWNILNDDYSAGYLNKLYNNLGLVKNMVFKNKELMDFLDSNFIGDVFSKINMKEKDTYIPISIGDRTTFYK